MTRADGRGRRLERVGRPFDRLGGVAGGRRGQRVEPLRQRLDEGREDPIDRFGRARFFHGAAERGDIHRRRCRRGRLGAVGAAAFDHREQLVGLERLREIAGHAPRQAALALPAQRVRRQRDDRERATLRQGANLRRRPARDTTIPTD